MLKTQNKKQRKSLIAPLIISGVFASAIIALSMTPTFSALVASIQNTANAAGTGSLAMQESNSDGTILCNSTDSTSNTATCATINKYGGNLAMIPGQTVTTNISIKNTGSVTATSFSLTGGTCTQSTNGTVSGTATDLCAKYNITIKSGSVTIYQGTAAALSGQTIDMIAKGIPAVAAGTTVPFTISAQLDSSASNTYQGLKISQPLTWTFGA